MEASGIRSVRHCFSWKRRSCLSVCVSDINGCHQTHKEAVKGQSLEAEMWHCRPREGPALLSPRAAALLSLAHPSFGTPVLLAQPRVGLCL